MTFSNYFNFLTSKPLVLVNKYAQKLLRLLTTTVAVTYSASMTPDVSLGGYFTITATNNTAFTINAPIGTPIAGELITIQLFNTSGGALGAATWNAVYKMSAWTNPATGFNRSITFRFDGTNWYQQGGASVDVAN